MPILAPHNGGFLQRVGTRWIGPGCTDCVAQSAGVGWMYVISNGVKISNFNLTYVVHLLRLVWITLMCSLYWARRSSLVSNHTESGNASMKWGVDRVSWHLPSVSNFIHHQTSCSQTATQISAMKASGHPKVGAKPTEVRQYKGYQHDSPSAYLPHLNICGALKIGGYQVSIYLPDICHKNTDRLHWSNFH